MPPGAKATDPPPGIAGIACCRSSVRTGAVRGRPVASEGAGADAMYDPAAASAASVRTRATVATRDLRSIGLSFRVPSRCSDASH